MPEQPQEVTVTNTAQPIVVVIQPVSKGYEAAQTAIVQTPPVSQTVTIQPVVH
jgi:hypothetical protein